MYVLYISTVLSSDASAATGLFKDEGGTDLSLFSLSLLKLCLTGGKSPLGRGVSTEISFSIGPPALESRSVCTRIGCGNSSATLASGLEIGPLGLTPLCAFGF